MFEFCTTTLIILNEEMNDIMKIIKYLEEFGFLTKDVSETIENEARDQRVGFLGIFFGTLGATWLGNLLTAKNTIRAVEGTIKAG